MWRHVVHDGIVESEFTGVGFVESGDDSEKGGFAASGGTEKEKEFPLLNLQAHVVDRNRRVECFCDMV